ncbi:hypothetical protein KAFR_0F03240 [Kazachstania africana CBS 2517]|uniref:ethanolamine-phosphate cytidylyltransferase n=1 Tax=Kazachstania africana (strain ATCC 22294 / BCRC 22015 / CBS 2517 / CECT 1963 / NBRC 1671 / NRRL Y-8276) TaxID=1071382 RepID=H2AX20_KAZAF|nr:hypothetical protein KAFR_0F03240 [Kazachstania africana CBS 2517]CCF58920.1 hypothetical protein KAFR_0F03240 [Kazachstania africana CBS 2517]
MTIELDANKVWIDGCFDFTHHGHAGAILQARRTILPPNEGELYCGVHSDEQITINKGRPVMTSPERYEHTRSNRWCTSVIEDAPYVTQPDVLDEYGCKYVVHGDDITLDANGEDCYQIMKDVGRFKVVKRTLGVSTTDIIHRILTGIYPSVEEHGEEYYPDAESLKLYSTAEDGYSKHCFVWKGDLNTVLVEGGFKIAENDLVLVVGDFDLFHMGQIDQLANVKTKMYANSPKCKLIVGVTLRDFKDRNKNTIMTLKERVLSVLSCKYVDGVIIDPTDEDSFETKWEIDTDPLIQSGKFSRYLTKQIIINRIDDQRDVYIKRNEKKGIIIE